MLGATLCGYVFWGDGLLATSTLHPRDGTLGLECDLNHGRNILALKDDVADDISPHFPLLPRGES